MKTFEEALETLSLAGEDADTPAGQVLEANVSDVGGTVFNSPGAQDLVAQMLATFMSAPPFNPIKFSLAMLSAGVQIGIAMEKSDEVLIIHVD